MHTLRLLVGLLLLTTFLAGCFRGTDPWDTTGWNVESFDYESDIWTPIDDCNAPAPACPPCPVTRSAPQAPPREAWSGGSTPLPRTTAPRAPASSGAWTPPPPPPPPYRLPR